MLDVIEYDMETSDVCIDDLGVCVKLKFRISMSYSMPPTPSCREQGEEEKGA